MAATAKAKQTELSISYSVGVKAQIVKYKLTGDVHISRTERFNVEGMTPEAIAEFYSERYEALKEDLDERISQEHAELIGQEQ